MSDSQKIPSTESSTVAYIAVAWEIVSHVAREITGDQELTPEQRAEKLAKIFVDTFRVLNK